jgi:hypothetical protein
MDTVGISVPTRQIKEFYTFSVSSALRNIVLQLGVSLLQMKFLDIFGKNIVSFEDTVSILEGI